MIMTNREDLARVLKDYQHLVNQYQKKESEVLDKDHIIQELQDKIDLLSANIEVLQNKIYEQ
tara:strand:- start:249 stop:434 length:186 start_codon:yes stop_codon:yes gene_type:complete